MREGKHLQIGIALALALVAGLSSNTAAFCQYSPWGYSPVTGSSSWLWLSRSLFSPSSMLFRGGYGYSAPYYVANTLAWNAAYAAGQGINAKTRQAYARQWNNPNNGINAPVVDQVSAAPWYYPPRGNLGAPVVGAAPAASDPFADPKAGEFMPVPSNFADPGQNNNALAATSNQTPPAAPDFKKGIPLPATEPARAPEASSSSSATQNPFAQAFVDHVNAKYSGDIGKALSDKQTRHYAEALGLLDKSFKDTEFPADRIELIKKILQDPEEDSLTKVNTVRLLLKH